METYLKMLNVLERWLVHHGVNVIYADAVKLTIVFVIIVLLALITDIVVKRVILVVVERIAKKTDTIFDDILVEKRVFHRLAHLSPAIVIYHSIKLPLAEFPNLLHFLQDVTGIYMVVVGLMVIMAFLKSLQAIYQTLPISKNHSITGYLQVLKIIVYILAGIFTISIINGKSPTALLAGLGAMAAILIFVFKDPILGLVASIQLSSNDMLRPGDWIEMPTRKADGIVKDISLTTVKVQNWDQTVTTIPTYTLVSDSFTNWRSMVESAEGRRIKRAVFIDMKSVGFYTDKILENLAKNPVVAKNFDVQNYLASVQQLDKHTNHPDHRTLTNLGMFRGYLEAYLRNSPVIHSEMTILVHNLQPTENGLPLEIIAFSKEKDGIPFEKIQSEIVDHILAIIPVFALKIFQRPSGEDFNKG
jgi:miniconductance mechanosensitive channel